MSRIKVTVMKKLSRSDVFGNNIPDIIDKPGGLDGKCGRHEVGESFISENLCKPEGLCDWAFSDIHKDLMYLAYGNRSSGPDKIHYAACTDGTNPVIFKLERVEGEENV